MPGYSMVTLYIEGVRKKIGFNWKRYYFHAGDQWKSVSPGVCYGSRDWPAAWILGLNMLIFSQILSSRNCGGETRKFIPKSPLYFCIKISPLKLQAFLATQREVGTICAGNSCKYIRTAVLRGAPGERPWLGWVWEQSGHLDLGFYEMSFTPALLKVVAWFG